MNNEKISRGFSSILLFSCLMAVQVAGAQDLSSITDKTPEERALVQTAWMTSKLGLDSAQTSQVRIVNLNYARKNDPILKSDAGKLSKFRQLKSNQNDKDAELKKIFTKDQYKQYQVVKEEMKEKMKEKRKQQ